MGIYDSRLSCWERRVRNLPQDNAGENPIDNPQNIDVKTSNGEPNKATQEIPQDEVVDKKPEKKTRKKSTKDKGEEK